MPFAFRGRPEFAGLDRSARRDVRRLAWHFAQRHWSLHAPAFAWLVFVLLHTRYGVVAGRSEYLWVTLGFFVVAVIVIRLHIAHYLRPARAIFDLMGASGIRAITRR